MTSRLSTGDDSVIITVEVIPLKRLLLLILFSAACYAQAASLTLSCPNNVKPGANLACSMSLTSGGTVAGTEFQLTASIPTGTINVTAAGTALAAGKTASCNSAGLCLIVGLNQTLITDGQIASISIPIPVSAPGGNMTITVSNTVSSSLAGSVIPTTANPPVAVSVLSNCDLNADGVVNAADVALIQVNILAQPQVATDKNGDGKTDVVDAQIIINAASGKACTATQ